MRNAATLLLLAVLLLGVTAPARALQQFVDVRQVASDTIRDVARTAVANGRTTIYYNPTLMQHVGPLVAAFTIAHEYGHIRYGHTGGALATMANRGGVQGIRQRQELEADCYAARILGETHPEAVAAAVQFFTRMGPFRFDSVHPSGAQRAAKILACLPDG